MTPGFRCLRWTSTSARATLRSPRGPRARRAALRDSGERIGETGASRRSPCRRSARTSTHELAPTRVRFDDARLVIERRMRRRAGARTRSLRKRTPRPSSPAEPCHARGTPGAPSSPWSVGGELLERRLRLLQRDDVGLLVGEELHELGLARAHAVDVPGDDLQRPWTISLHGRETTKAPGLPTIDVNEYGGKKDGERQAMNRRLFMQLLVFDVARDADEPTTRRSPPRSGAPRIPAVVYADAMHPRGVGLLTWSEDPAHFVRERAPALRRRCARRASCDLDFAMLGRTYARATSPTSSTLLAPLRRERARTRRTPWHVWYPLRRTGEFARLDAPEGQSRSREHAQIGMAYGAAGARARRPPRVPRPRRRGQRVRHRPRRPRAPPAVAPRAERCARRGRPPSSSRRWGRSSSATSPIV